jgi:hypothetical protein
LSLCFNGVPRQKGVLGEWKYSSTHCLTSALDAGERSASRADRFTPRARAPLIHWIGGWVGPRAVLKTYYKIAFNILFTFVLLFSKSCKQVTFMCEIQCYLTAEINHVNLHYLMHQTENWKWNRCIVTNCWKLY